MTLDRRKECRMRLSAVTKENVEGFKALLLPEAASAIRRGEDISALGLLDETEEIPAAIAAIAGIASDGAFQILSLMVEKKYRRKGYGRYLVEMIEAQAKDFGLSLSAEYPAATEGQELLEDFFLHLGFEEGDIEYPMVRFSLSDLMEEDPGEEETPINSFSFAELPAEILRRAEARAKKEILPMPESGFFSAQVNREYSFGVVDEGELSAYVTLEELSEKELLLSSLWCQNPVTMAKPLLSGAFRRVKKSCPGDTTVYAFVGSDDMGNFIERRCKNAETVSRKFVKYYT